MAVTGLSLQIGRLCRMLPATLLFRSVSSLVIVLLVSVTFLGIRQYLLCHQCRKVVAASDQLLFSFTAIKDHISESLLSGQPVDITVLGSELQVLADRVQRLDTEGYLPQPLSDIQAARGDLVELTVRLRRVFNASAQERQESLALIRSLNSINIRFQHFRIALSDHSRTMLVGLQKMIIGALALTVVVACWALISVNHHIALPILRLSNLIAGAPSLDERSLEEVVGHFSEEAALLERLRNILAMLARLPRGDHHPEKRIERWQAICKAVATNPDYDLVWVGKGTTPPGGVKLVCSSGELEEGKNGQQANCPAYDGTGFGVCPAVRQVIRQQQPVSTTEAPAVSENRILSAGQAVACPGSCAAFPIHIGASPWFFALVSLQPHCFSAGEMELLRLGLHQVLSMEASGQPLDRDISARNLAAATEAGCCATCGYLGTAAGGTIINSLNGTINYCQVLKDSRIKTASRPVRPKLNDALLLEAEETAELAICLLRFFRAMENPDECSPLTRLVHSLATILVSALRADGIEIQVHCPHTATAGVPDKACWLLLLNLFQMGRNALVDAEEHYRVKVIHLSSVVHLRSPRLVLSLTNSSGQWVESSPDHGQVWQSFGFCRQLIQHHEGQLREVLENDQSTVLQVELPLREEGY